MMKYVFVLSHAFSGSTLMAHLLGSHPAIATTGETTVTRGRDVSRYLCSCGIPIKKCPFWDGVARVMSERGFAFDVGDPDLHFRDGTGGLGDVLLRLGPRSPALEAARFGLLSALPGARARWQSLLRRNEAFAEAVASVRQRPVFLDTSKHPTRLLHLMRIPSFDMHVVHLVRDFRAVSNSCMKNLGMAPEAGAESWARDAVASERMERMFRPERWHRLRYEDVCRTPRETISKVFAFIGVPDDDSFLRFGEAEHHIIGNRMRLASHGEIRLDEKWRTELGEEQLRLIEARAASTGRRYGYV